MSEIDGSIQNNRSTGFDRVKTVCTCIGIVKKIYHPLFLSEAWGCHEPSLKRGCDITYSEIIQTAAEYNKLHHIILWHISIKRLCLIVVITYPQISSLTNNA